MSEKQGLVRVVIVGGGFGGLQVARKLAGRSDVAVTVIDRRNHHLFQPLLYQVATAGLSPAEIAVPIRSILSGTKNTEVYLGTVENIHADQKKITTSFDKIEYDYLILACGSEQSYFGHEEWAKFAPGLKTVDDATEVRRRVLLSFELAERESDPQKIKAHLTFVIVGGGPTGVELSGAIGEITRYTLSRDFQKIRPSSTRVILIEAGSRILESFAPELSHSATRELEALGVTVWSNSRVLDISDKGVRIGNEWIESNTVIWAAGVKPSFLNAKLGTPLDKGGRVIVENDCSLAKYKEVFVLGDQAHFQGVDGKPLPGLAPVAMQQGRFVADLIISELKGKPRKQFRYLDKGQLATIGRKRAVLQLGSFKMSGFLAWLAWLFVHVYYLIGFKNRLFVIWSWAYAYFTYRRGARLITQTPKT
jgi:NADH:ubiquinone reductase (H+-translocating)